jgi:SAM-dependent methyltransferase
MKYIIKKLIRLAQLPFIVADFWRFYRVNDNRFSMRLVDVYPCIKDKTIKTGFDRHYVYFTAWAARQVKKVSPEKHIDISSSLYFAGIVSAFVPVEFYDYRPADLSLSNLESKQADLTRLPFDDNSVSSLSCMHVVEHIGLGRYGDPIDSEGDIKAARELARVLAKGGKLLFVVPVGAKSRIEYNAHRIYSYETALSLFPDLKLEEFTLIPEKSGVPIINAGPESVKNESYACGCFVFTKL